MNTIFKYFNYSFNNYLLCKPCDLSLDSFNICFYHRMDVYKLKIVNIYIIQYDYIITLYIA